MKLLIALEAAGVRYKTVRADIEYRLVNRRLGDSETRTGWVAYQARQTDDPAKFRIHFRTLRQGRGKRLLAMVDYAFDGRWLTVKKHSIRQLSRYQVAAAGQKVEPLRLGQGFFPLPFGQKAADVLTYFDVRTRKPNPTDPKDTDYLKLTIRPGHRRTMNVERMEMWIDRKTHLPVRIQSRDRSRNDTTVRFTNVKTNPKLDKGVFFLPKPRGWKRVRIETLKRGTNLKP